MRVTARNSTIIFPPLYVAQSIFYFNRDPNLESLATAIIYKRAVTDYELTVSPCQS